MTNEGTPSKAWIGIIVGALLGGSTGWIANIVFSASNQVVAGVTIFGLVFGAFVGGMIGFMIEEKKEKIK